MAAAMCSWGTALVLHPHSLGVGANLATFVSIRGLKQRSLSAKCKDRIDLRVHQKSGSMQRFTAHTCPSKRIGLSPAVFPVHQHASSTGVPHS